VNGKSSGLPQRTGAAGLNSRMRPASAARPSPLHSNTFFDVFLSYLLENLKIFAKRFICRRFFIEVNVRFSEKATTI
jgi:hypothetical protein